MKLNKLFIACFAAISINSAAIEPYKNPSLPIERVVEPGDFEIQIGTASNNISSRHTIIVK